MIIVGTGQVLTDFSDKLWKEFLHMFFPLFFPPILHLLSPSMPLFTKYWAGHHLSISKNCAWNCSPRLGLKPMWQGPCAMLSHSVMSDWDLSLVKIHGDSFQDLMKLRFLMSHCKKVQWETQWEVRGRLFGFRERHSPQSVSHHRGYMQQPCNVVWLVFLWPGWFHILMSGRITPTIGEPPTPWSFHSTLELLRHLWVCHLAWRLRIKV